MPNPACQVKDGAGSFATPTNGANVTPSNTVTIKLTSSAGVESWGISCVGTDELGDAAAINASLVIDPLEKTATFTAPVEGRALLFRSVVNGGVDINHTKQDSYATTFGVFTTVNGSRCLALNSRFESNAEFGWIVDFNSWIRAGAGGGEVNVVANIGGGVELFKNKTGATLNLKTLVQGDNVTIADDGDTVTISAAAGGGGAPMPGDAGEMILSDGAGGPVALAIDNGGADEGKSPRVVSGLMQLAETTEVENGVPGHMAVYDTDGKTLVDGGEPGEGGGGGVSDVENVGDGAEVLKEVDAGVAKLRTLVEGSNITIDEGENTITIHSAAEAGGPPTGGAGGDLGGSYPNPDVMKLRGATAPAAGALTVGNIVFVSGASALSYGPLDLAGGANYVTGLLPTANQAAQSLVGDATGTTAASVVSKVRGATVNTAAGSLTVGNALKVTGGSTLDYSAVNLAGGSGHVTGALPIGNQAPPAGDGLILFADNGAWGTDADFHWSKGGNTLTLNGSVTYGAGATHTAAYHRFAYNGGNALSLIGVKDSTNTDRSLLTWGAGNAVTLGNSACDCHMSGFVGSWTSASAASITTGGAKDVDFVAASTTWHKATTHKNTVAFTEVISGDAAGSQPLKYARASVAVGAGITLSAAQYACPFIVFTSGNADALTVFPAADRAIWFILNLSGVARRIGTGSIDLTIASGKGAVVACHGGVLVALETSL